MDFEKKTIGGLNCIEVPGEGPTIIMLHGYGSTNNDLAPLSRIMPSARWLFPAGPEKIVFGPDYTGYSWFDVDVPSLRDAVREHDYPFFEKALGSDLEKASAKFRQFLGEVEGKNLVLGGFSQGAIVALDTALTMDERIKAMILLSPSLAREKVWTERAAKKKGLPFFMSHGKEDDVLPYQLSEKLEKILVDAGLNGKLHSFTGHHEVPFSLLLELQPFLNSIFT
ncbi:MAG: hypothetical protein S4CHLAM81_10690 [Chlamydiales bacterium]|nr:hypothetical protein [Chlamydiales bacterium]MCH9635847.1 hypothetical protein [Chlamydiales bacterium]MCH9704125.1 dienelactone hydrolase family protein [Chlamydiota bacterium]